MKHYALTQLVCLSLFSYAAAQGCAFPTKWYQIGSSNFWWTKYEDKASDEISLYSFNGTMMSNVVVPEHYQCEGSYQYATNSFTYAAVRQVDTSQRFCFEAFRFDNAMMYHKTVEVNAADPYTNEQCRTSLAPRVSWDLWVMFPFDVDSVPLSLDTTLQGVEGVYQLTYRVGASTLNQCQGDMNSTVTITGNKFIISACKDQNSYERPLQTTLRIVGTVGDYDVRDTDIVGPPGFMALANVDNSGINALHSFYCARYTITSGFLQLVFSVESEDWAKCAATAEFFDQNVRDNDHYLTFELRSDECMSNPCQNGGTCVQEWKRFQCLCNSDFFGIDCKDPHDRKNPCEHVVCLNGGQCLPVLDQTVDNFVCDCALTFSSRYCQERAPWFIAAVVLGTMLLIIFLILLILCICHCCCGWRVSDKEDEASIYSGTRTLESVTSKAPSTVQFNVTPPNPYYGFKILGN